MRPALVLLVALLGSTVAMAQSEGGAKPEGGGKPSATGASARLVKDKEAQTFNEIERGFYVGVGGGGWLLFNPPVATNCPVNTTGCTKQYFSPGLSINVELGFDIGERVSIGAFFIAAYSKMGADYTALSRGGASGDFTAFMPGLAARINIVGFNDAQDVRRWWIFVRAGGAVTLYFPKALFNDPQNGDKSLDVLIWGGPGIEYHTRLRHFSIALEADFVCQVLTTTFGVNIMPTLRYAF
jgi:hypothetical protein